MASSPRYTYADYRNVNGTIYNTKNSIGYKATNDPTTLAGNFRGYDIMENELGLAPGSLDITKIQSDANYNPETGMSGTTMLHPFYTGTNPNPAPQDQVSTQVPNPSMDPITQQHVGLPTKVSNPPAAAAPNVTLPPKVSGQPQGLSFDAIKTSQLSNGGTAENPYRGAPAQVPISGMLGSSGGQSSTQSPLPSPSGAIQGSGIPAKAGGTDYMAQILKYMVPSQDETNTQGQIDNLTTSAQMGINNVNAEPIPYATKYGTAKNIEDQVNTKIETLSQKLARLQAARQTSLQVSQFSLDRADKAEAEAKAQTEQLRQEAKADASGLKEYVTKLASEGNVSSPWFNHSGTVYKSDGTKAYSNAAEFLKDAGVKDFAEAYAKGILQDYQGSGVDLKQYPASYQEYLLAQKDGYKGNYNDYQNMDANRKAVRSSTVNNYGIDKGLVAEESRVKQIISTNPGEWGAAAAQIDKEFGAGTATKYNALLKDAYTKKDSYENF